MTVTAFATTDELFRILKIRTPSADQTTAATETLLTAAGEIYAEIDLADTDTLADWETDLCKRVNLDRAADLWRHTESVPGVGTILDADMTIAPGRYSWQRYAERLAPVKRQWGLA
jgi:hypothetical protein